MSMLRKKITEEKLKEQGWKYVLDYGTLNLFKNNEGTRILWNPKTKEVTHQYSKQEWDNI